MSNGRSLGQIAYEGYRTGAGGVSLVSGEQLPAWADLPAEIQAAWQAGAQDVARSLPANKDGIEYR